jgi:methionine-rich copper-binding protein CopC
MGGRIVGRWAVSMGLLGLVAVMPPAPALSHAVLVRAAPPARAILRRPPERVRLWFSEPIEPAFSSASVWSASGTQVDRRDARVDPGDPRQLSVTLPAIDPGTYTVRCRVVSVDGHVFEASFSFTVKPGP